MQPFLSYQKEGETPRKGSLFDVPYECQNRGEKCNHFCAGLFRGELERFVRCPFGYATYVTKVGITGKETRVVFCGLRVRGVVPRGKGVGDSVFLPSIDEQRALKLITQQCQCIVELEQGRSASNLKDELLHGMSKILSTCQAKSESLLSTLDKEDGNVIITHDDRVALKTILMGNIQLRNQFYVISLRNNDNLPEKTFKTSVYNKFFKARKLLNRYQGRDVRIELKGESYNKYRLSASFEMMPYLLLENAVKFSLEGSVVDVCFVEKEQELTITVGNNGPMTRKQHTQLCRDRERGENSDIAGVQGSGIGLFTCDRIASRCGIAFKVEPSKEKSITVDGVPYAHFNVSLNFPNALFEERGSKPVVF